MSKNNQKIKQLMIIGLIILIATGMGATIGAVTWVIQQSPDISNYGQWKTSETTVVYASNGDVLTQLYKENRIYVPLEKIPEDLQNAVISIEDARFYQHHGIDPKGILRAIWVDLKHMAKVQGASTITQQLAKNALLTHKKLFSRKLQEMYIALQFERMYIKQEILEFYLNEIFLGHSAYGVQSAAHFYFNKDVQNLTLSESALLAGLIRAPNHYSPRRNKEEAKERRNLVLNQMVKYNYISQNQAEEAKKEPIKLEEPENDQDTMAPYFVRHIRNKLIDKFGAKRVYTGGLQVYTSLDPTIQNKAQETIDQALESGYLPTTTRTAGRGEKQPQLALVSLDPATGYIKAMIGGRGEDKFNRATQAHRQPGSAFKPFVYTTALKQGIGPGEVVDDTPKVYQTTAETDDNEIWIPTNYDNKYRGPTTLRIALAKSINVASVKLLDKVGISNTIKTATDLGIESIVEEDENLASIGLGGLTKGVTPLEMAKAYSTFANGGIRIKPTAITKVKDKHGNLIWNNAAENKTKKELVLDDSVAYLITDMLQSVMARGPLVWGTGWRANLGQPAAGKTGTTSQYTDAWFVGYTPDLVSSIWIGEDQPTTMKYTKKNGAGNIKKDKNGEPIKETISSGEAAKLWGDYMNKVVANRPIKDFQKPSNIISKKICTESGKLPNSHCTEEGTVRKELFIQGTAPTEECQVHKETKEVKIDTSTGLLATEYCPADKVVTKRYQVDSKILVDENGVPIKKFQESDIKREDGKNIKLPVRDEEGNYVYKKVPTEKCDQHKPQDQDQDNIKDKIINFFNAIQKDD